MSSSATRKVWFVALQTAIALFKAYIMPVVSESDCIVW